MPGEMTAPTAAATIPPPLPARLPRLFVYAIIALLLSSGAAVLFAFNPAETRLFPPCPFHAITGLYCPGCGSTRAMHQLLHGHVVAAFGYNALGVIALPFIAFALARDALGRLGVRAAPPISRGLPWWWGWVVFGVVIGFGVARNLPWEPFRRLAP